MTTETEVSAIEAKKVELEAAKTELATATEVANTAISDLMATNPAYDLTFAAHMAEINSPVAVITSRIERLTREYNKLNESTRWETSKAIRQPVLDLIKEFIVEPLTVSMTGMTGTIKIVDGEAVVVLNPTFKAPDMTMYQNDVAAMIDVDAFVESELTNLSVSVKDIGLDTQTIYLNPMGMKAGSTGQKGKGAGITRSKPREYFAGGSWKSAKEFLTLVLNSGDAEAQKRIKGFQGAIDTGSGAYKLAVETAERLNVESREKGSE